jgi:cellulose synthase operon protein C
MIKTNGSVHAVQRLLLAFLQPQSPSPDRLRVSALTLLSLVSGLMLMIASVAQPTQAQTSSQGYLLLKKGWVNDAIATFQQDLRRNPQSLEAKLGLAIAYQRAGQNNNAWNAYRQVLNQDPQNRTALEAVGLLGGYQPDWQQEGITALTMLLKLTPNDQSAQSQRALLYGYQGRFSEALADYQIVLQANPKPEILLGAAQIYAYSGDYSQGLALFDRYQSAGQSITDQAVPAYALALREMGQAGKAVQILESRLKQRSAIELQTALAIAYQANDQPEAASALLETLRGNPTATLPLARALSTIARQSGDSERAQEAIDLYRQFLKQTTPSLGLMTEFADVLSEVPASRAESLQLYQTLTQQSPSDRSLGVKQLVIARQLGQISRSQQSQELQKVLQPLPDALSDRRLLAQALLKVDPADPQFLPVYQSLLDSGVEVPFLNFRMAQMQIERGDLTAAKQSLATYQATQIGSQDLATELLFADLDRRENKLEASAQRYESLIARNPKPQVLNNALKGLVAIRLAQGRLDEALTVYDQRLSRDPQNGDAQLGRASLAYQAKRLSESEAETVLDRWLQRSTLETPPELFSLVGALPPDPQREQLYDRLLQVEPENLPVLRRSLQVLAKRDPDQARSRLKAIVNRTENSIDAYLIQGELASSLGELQLASTAYQEILQRQPDNVDALAALGGVRFEQKRYPEATKLYHQVLALRPNNWDVHRVLADLYLAQDQPFAGLRQLQQAQTIQGVTNPAIADRIQQIKIDRLKRRGFQPSWERY